MLLLTKIVSLHSIKSKLDAHFQQTGRFKTALELNF